MMSDSLTQTPQTKSRNKNNTTINRLVKTSHEYNTRIKSIYIKTFFIIVRYMFVEICLTVFAFALII